MAFNDLQLKVASEEAILALQRHMASLKFFAHNFKELESRRGSKIAVPIYSLTEAATFSQTNNWGVGGDEIDGAEVVLDKHLIKSISLEDRAAGDCEVNFLRDGARAIADVVGHGANKAVYQMFNETNCPTSADMPTTKQAFAGLMKVCSDAGVNPYESVLVLDPESYGALLASLDSYIFGGPEAIKYGVIENLYGFRAVLMSSYLPAGTKGVIIPYFTVGIASRVNKPAIDGYVNTWSAVSSDGFSIGFRAYEDLAQGVARLGGDVLFGCALFQNDKIIRLV